MSQMTIHPIGCECRQCYWKGAFKIDRGIRSNNKDGATSEVYRTDRQRIERLEAMVECMIRQRERCHTNGNRPHMYIEKGSALVCESCGLHDDPRKAAP